MKNIEDKNIEKNIEETLEFRTTYLNILKYYISNLNLCIFFSEDLTRS